MIRVKNLTYTYPAADRPVLLNVDLRVEEGEFVALTGPTGCGKTTLCRCLNGLIPHFYGGKVDGEVTVAGLNVLTRSTSELAQHVGFVFQSPENQLFSLSVERDVAFGVENLAVPRDELRSRVEWALKVAGIADLRDRPPHELSGGQQQRVAIASVLAMRPKVIVLDEPTSFLDPQSARSILEVIGGLNRDLNITVLIVEHRLELVSKYARRVAVMYDGKIRFDGDPRDIFSRDEAELKVIGIPKVTRLHNLLVQDGVLHQPTSLSAEELSSQLRSVLPYDKR